jgi:hypothetical protein
LAGFLLIRHSHIGRKKLSLDTCPGGSVPGSAGETTKEKHGLSLGAVFFVTFVYFVVNNLFLLRRVNPLIIAVILQNNPVN